MEKGIEAELKTENLWDRRPEVIALNPAGDVPVLVEENGQAICDSAAICEYLEEVAPKTCLLPVTAEERAEIRRLVSWLILNLILRLATILSAKKF